MALINNLYIHVIKEEESRSVDVTQHPVEAGIKITDNVRLQPLKLGLRGKLVANENTSASTVRDRIQEFQKSGTLISFLGVHHFTNAIITNFKTEASADISGGFDFDMDLEEVRIAKSAYRGSSTTTSTTKQVTPKKSPSENRYYTVKSGDCPWSIAVKYYGNGLKWERMMKANSDIIARNKKRGVLWYMLYVGDKLLIPNL